MILARMETVQEVVQEACLDLQDHRVRLVTVVMEVVVLQVLQVLQDWMVCQDLPACLGHLV